MKIPLRQYGRFLAGYLRPQIRLVLLLALLLGINIALQLVNPQIMRRFIDTIQSGGAMQVLFGMALLYLGIALGQQVVAVLATYTSEVIGWTATNAIRNDLTMHCLRLDLSFHNAHTPGEMIERIDGDATAVSSFFATFTVQIFSNILLLAGILAALYAVDWRVGLVLSVFTAITLAVAFRFRDITVPYWEKERQASADLFGFLEERLAGTEDIRANGAQAYVMRRFYQLMRALMQRSLAAALRVNVLLNTMWFLFALGNALALATGAYLFLEKTISIGTVYMIFNYTNILQRPIDAIVHQMQDLQRAGAGMLRILGLFNIPSRILNPVRELAGRVSIPDQQAAQSPEVVFDHLSFGYHDQILSSVPIAAELVKPAGSASAGDASRTPVTDQTPPDALVLHDIHFRLAPGRVLGLLGRTGSGKTSLTRLLFRFYDPDQGAVRLGAPGSAADIRGIPLKQLRRQVGMVTQNIQLFNASVRDNLTFFDTSVPDEQVVQAIAALGLSEWYQALPKGLDSELEAGGAGLSAGEAQLLAFTRIFLRNPGLVILDEASSRLDPATETRVERAVEQLVKGRTAIIVAHRLATIQRADDILILEGGRVMEYGPRSQLASDPSTHFYHLLQAGMEEVLA
jgi:ATP-binding cassette subfamily B protein